VSAALRDHYRAELAEMASHADGPRILELMKATPSLTDYASQMWLRHEDALVAAITEELGSAAPIDAVRVYVRFALQIPLLASDSPDPDAMVRLGFQVLDDGWVATAPAQ